MGNQDDRVDAIDLERVIFDPEYRRAVIDELKALRRDERQEAAEPREDDRGESFADDNASFLRSSTD